MRGRPSGPSAVSNVHEETTINQVRQQIWQAGLNDGSLRVATNDENASDGEMLAESYWLVPNRSNPRLLVPAGQPRVTSRALTKYRSLRSKPMNLARGMLGGVAALGLPLSRDKLAVFSSVTRNNISPINVLRQDLGVEKLYMATGVRLGLNAKPTLHLFDESGNPLGFAKLAWNEASSELITNETKTLKNLSGGFGTVRVPQLLSSGELGGYPYLVTSPVPENARGLQNTITAPSPAEIGAISPVIGQTQILELAWYQNLRSRIGGLIETEENSSPLVLATKELVGELDHLDSYLPLIERWHGDLVPWNCARTSDGTLWCWDWESSQRDVVGGLDVIHWNLNVQLKKKANDVVISLKSAVRDSMLHLRSIGLDDRRIALTTAIYTLTIIERAWTLATNGGGWSRSWISATELYQLADHASQQLRSVD